MASKDYPKREEQANQQGQQALAAQPVVDSSQLLATLTQVFSTFQEHLQKQLQDQPPREFGTNALTAASVFNDIVAGLQLKFPPERPNLIIKSEAISSTEVKLEWTADDNTNNTDGFKVWRSQGQDSDPFIRISEPPLPSNARTYTDVQVSSGTTYRYKVSAFNVRGEADSNIVKVTTQGGIP